MAFTSSEASRSVIDFSFSMTSSTAADMPTFATRDEAMREPQPGMAAGHTRPETEAAKATHRTLNSMAGVGVEGRGEARPDLPASSRLLPERNNQRTRSLGELLGV